MIALPQLRGTRWLQLRHDWPVRWAHHPVCSRHRLETLKLGQLYLCRGCLSLAAGLVAGNVAVWTYGTFWCTWAVALLAAPVIVLSWPNWYRQLPRALRDVLRVALGLLIVSATGILANGPWWAWSLLPAVAGLWWVFRRARVQVLARRCAGCPELGGGVCSGYAPHARAARAISAALEARIAAAMAHTYSKP